MSLQIKQFPEKTQASNDDWLLIQDTQATKKISRSNFLAGLSGSSSSSSGLATAVTSGLQLEYRFDNGIVITDYSGNNRHGQSGNTAGVDSQDVSPISWLGHGVNFGGDDFISAPSGNYFGASFTVECCFYQRNYAAWARVFDFGNGQAQNNILLSSSSNGSGRLHFDIIANGQYSNPVIAPFSTPLNQWIYTSINFDDSSAIGQIFVNNAFQSEGVLLRPDNVTRNNNYLARSNWWGEPYFDGCFALFRIYNRKLSLAERTNNFTNSFNWLLSKGIKI